MSHLPSASTRTVRRRAPISATSASSAPPRRWKSRSLLDPGAEEIQPQNRSFRVVTRDGAIVTGRLLNRDSCTVQMIDSQRKLRSFSIASLRESSIEQTPMPSYRRQLTPDELTDVVKYLVTAETARKPSHDETHTLPASIGVHSPHAQVSLRQAGADGS